MTAKGKGKTKAEAKTELPQPKIPTKPRIDPCAKECPIYYILDVRKCLRSPKYDEYLGSEDELIYFKQLDLLKGFLSDLRLAQERKQQRQDACVELILDQFI